MSQNLGIYNPERDLISQLEIKKQDRRALNFKEVKLPGFYQPARSKILTQIDYQPLQLPNGDVLDVSKRTMSGFKEGSYNLFINGTLADRDVLEDDIEKSVQKLTKKAKLSF